jgi:hypothetical protein
MNEVDRHKEWSRALDSIRSYIDFCKRSDEPDTSLVGEVYYPPFDLDRIRRFEIVFPDGSYLRLYPNGDILQAFYMSDEVLDVGKQRILEDLYNKLQERCTGKEIGSRNFTPAEWKILKRNLGL